MCNEITSKQGTGNLHDYKITISSQVITDGFISTAYTSLSINIYSIKTKIVAVLLSPAAWDDSEHKSIAYLHSVDLQRIVWILLY